MMPVDQWAPTAAHARAVIGGVLLAALAVVEGRPDLLVLAVPLLVVAGWAATGRPRAAVAVEQSLAHRTAHEGDTTSWCVQVAVHDRRVEQVAAVLEGATWVHVGPIAGRRLVSPADDTDVTEIQAELHLLRWGRHRVQPALVVLTSSWGAFRWVAPRRPGDARVVHSLPRVTPVDPRSMALRAPGLTGVHVSPRVGNGTEFESVRPFRVGDRRSRINWIRSQRTGALHCDATWADHDQHIEILIDATEDIGQSGGVDGRASSLDLAARAASSLAAHHLRQGERVGLTVLGSRDARRVPPGAGRPQLRRVLHAIASVEPAPDFALRGRPTGISPATRVIVLSPLLSANVVDRVVSIASGGSAVGLIDCLPSDIAYHDPDELLAEAAWGIERLKRRRHLARLRNVGVAVVSGSGSVATGYMRSNPPSPGRRPAVRTS